MGIQVSYGLFEDHPAWKTVGLAAAVKGHEDAYPFLARAAAEVKPAASTKVEWLVDGPEGPVSWFNWTQIIRTPFGESHAQHVTDSWEKTKAKYLVEHLTTVERTILDGRLFRQINYYFDEETGEWYPVETRGMGGVRFYLRREPTVDDYISLRVLRDCTFLDRTMPDFDGRRGEYLSEISLEVRPAVLAVAA